MKCTRQLYVCCLIVWILLSGIIEHFYTQVVYTGVYYYLKQLYWE